MSDHIQKEDYFEELIVNEFLTKTKKNIKSKTRIQNCLTQDDSDLLDNEAHDSTKTYNLYNQYGENNMETVGPIGIIALPSSRVFTDGVNSHLRQRRQHYLELNPNFVNDNGFFRDDYTLGADYFRFLNGEGKCLLSETVKGHDIYILVDVLNYSCTYNFHGQTKPMSPDEHYQDLKRTIQAISGKARRINVIMPFIYEGRQHKRNDRESLDCAQMLIELENLGVSNFITFDAHDPRVSNATPLLSFENIPCTYQTIKSLKLELPHLSKKTNNLMVISPDEGGIPRAMYFASLLGVPLGTFYKRRDYTKIVNGRNPIVAHEFLGESTENVDVLIVDDMISSGDSMLDIAKELKNGKTGTAGNIYCAVTFGLFSNGLEKFNEAYEQGLIKKVFSTNLIYRPAELLNAPWYQEINMHKFVALLIDAMNHDASVSTLISAGDKIDKVLNS